MAVEGDHNVWARPQALPHFPQSGLPQQHQSEEIGRNAYIQQAVGSLVTQSERLGVIVRGSQSVVDDVLLLKSAVGKLVEDQDLPQLPSTATRVMTPSERAAAIDKALATPKGRALYRQYVRATS